MAKSKPSKKAKVVTLKPTGPIRLDLGCGKNKRQDGEWIGVDILPFEGVDLAFNIGKDPWPFEDQTVDEVYASHVVEHLVPAERVHFTNELYRVLKNPEYDNAGKMSKGFATIMTPHWASQRAYGDMTHVWPPVSEFWFYYLDKDWRAVNAPHNQDYTCDLHVTWGYGVHPEIQSRNPEYQQNALKFWKEACTDTIAQMSRKQR
jgi:hypothetical protein